MTLIAEDVLLLLLDDESGKLTATTSLDNLLGGAVLIELALDGQIAVTVPERRWASGKVRPVGAPPPADPVLAGGLAVVAEKERRAQDIRDRVAAGEFDSISAFVTLAAQSYRDVEPLDLLIASMVAETGPPDPAAEAWAESAVHAARSAADSGVPSSAA